MSTNRKTKEKNKTHEKSVFSLTYGRIKFNLMSNKLTNFRVLYRLYGIRTM